MNQRKFAADLLLVMVGWDVDCELGIGSEAFRSRIAVRFIKERIAGILEISMG